MPHIEVRNVSLVYDTPSGSVAGLGDVSFDIEASEFLCLLGPSGCGKTTLLNIMAGFLRPTGGGISIGGKPVSGHGTDRGILLGLMGKRPDGIDPNEIQGLIEGIRKSGLLTLFARHAVSSAHTQRQRLDSFDPS